MQTEESQLIHAFSKGNNERIQMAVRKYNDRYYVDLRIWYQTKEDPAFRPTKKGLSFLIDYLPEMSQGVERLLRVRNKFKQTVETLGQ
ncbi:MAG: transcriptional coactivator p15/PC4 family protein [Candidatus Omnitrophica bacterium]|nr:transcriptional coactivator p15/PC4 family protein [Candidatus Omnitrophota bacterium]